MASSPLDTVVEISTPEHLAFRSRLAGPGRRLLAWMLDSLAWWGIFLVLSILVEIVGAAGLDGFDDGITFFLLFAMWWGYFFVSEVVTGGRSIGKAALKLRVVHGNGLPVTWKASLLRNLLRAADLALVPPMVLILGPLVMATDARFRRLGDLVADTLVIVEEQTGVDTNQFVHEPDPEIIAALPKALSLDRRELEALELFASRRRIGPARREELAGMVAPIFADRLAMPPPRNNTAFALALWARASQNLLDETPDEDTA